MAVAVGPIVVVLLLLAIALCVVAVLALLRLRTARWQAEWLLQSLIDGAVDHALVGEGAPALSCSQLERALRQVGSAILGGVEIRTVPAEDLGGRVPVESLRARVPLRNASGWIQHHHRVVDRAVDQRL